MQIVLTQMGVLTALVMQDTVVMASAVKVNTCITWLMRFDGKYLGLFWSLSDIFVNY